MADPDLEGDPVSFGETPRDVRTSSTEKKQLRIGGVDGVDGVELQQPLRNHRWTVDAGGSTMFADGTRVPQGAGRQTPSDAASSSNTAAARLNRARSRSMDSMRIPEGALRCANNHPMDRFVVPEGKMLSCDTCMRQFAAGTVMMSCKRCSTAHYMCSSCSAKGDEGQRPVWRRWLSILLDPVGLFARFRRPLALMAMVAALLAWRQLTKILGSSDRTRVLSWVVTGYSLGIILLLGFYAFENGPCHRTRGIESMYLAFALTVIVMASNLLRPFSEGSNWPKNGNPLSCVRNDTYAYAGTRLTCTNTSSACPPGGCTVGGKPALEICASSCLVEADASIQLLIWLILMRRILQHVGAHQMHPSFQEGPCAAARTAAAERWVPAATPRAKRVALELEDNLSEIFRKEVEASPSSNWELGILMLLILDRAIRAYPTSLTFLLNVAKIVEVFMVFPFLYLVLRRCFMAPAIQKICVLVEDLVARGDKATLQYVLATISVGTLLEVASRCLDALTEGALRKNLLSPFCKAVLIDALQKKGMVLNGRCQEAACKVLLSCHAEELTALKNMVDGSGSHHNLYKLVYNDITDARLRRRILRHFAWEAHEVRKALGHRKGVKVLSDVDDTLYSSGGKFPAGCDRRFPHHMIYPGCLALYRTLDKEWNEKEPTCNLVFLSARPHVYKGVSEDHSYQLFMRLVREGLMHSLPTLLPGRLLAGIRVLATYPCLRTRAWAPVGDLKVKMYRRYRMLYQEYDFMFIGDNGQGDLWAGQFMVAAQAISEALPHHNQGSPKGSRRRQELVRAQTTTRGRAGTHDSVDPGQAHDGSKLLAVLIHQVLEQEACLSREKPRDRGPYWVEEQRETKLFIFQSYVGAALALYRLDPELVSARELVEVANTAVEEFNDMRLMYLEWGSRWNAAEAALSRDLAEAMAAVRGVEDLPPFAPLQSIQQIRESAGLDGPVNEEGWLVATRAATPRFTIRSMGRERGSIDKAIDLIRNAPRNARASV